MNRTPAASRVDLPLVPAERAESREESGLLPRVVSGAGQAAPVIVPQRQPDGKGAPLPRNPKQFRRRLVLSILAAIMILVGSGLAALWLLRPAKDPTLVVPTQLGSFPPSSALAASPLSLQPNPAQSDQVNGLPFPASKAATLVKQPLLPADWLALQGLGQAQMGIQTPMDVSVAANAHYVVEAVDGGLQITNIDPKGKILTIGFVRFFSPVSHPGDVFGEPRVIFDPTGQQWVLVVNEVMVNNGNVIASYFDVGISTTSSPLDPWHVYQIATQSDEFLLPCVWADDPQLGSNVSGFFIAGSIFPCGVGGVRPAGSVLWELPRTTYGKGKSGALLRWAGFSISDDLAFLSVVPAIEVGPTKTEWLIANDAGYVNNGVTSHNISLWAVGPTASSEVASGLPNKVVPLPTSYADPPQAQQPSRDQTNPSPKLSTGDARIASAQFINGHLYVAFTTAVNWPGDKNTRAGIYWLDLVPSLSTRTNTVSVKQQQAGILGLPGGYLFMPTLVADAQGNLVLSAQISAANLPPGTIYASHHSSDPPSQMGQNGNTIILIQQGPQPFAQPDWGDYSGGGLVIYNSKEVYPKVWIAAPVVDPGAPGDQLASSWHTRLWEITTGGSQLENIE